MNREETRECLLRLLATSLRSPTPCRVSRFLSHFFADPHVFTEDAAVVTNPTRGVFVAPSGTGRHLLATLPWRAEHPA
jgi:hypothetical protein